MTASCRDASSSWRCAFWRAGRRSGLGPVVEDMPQVPAAVGAVDLGPDHEERFVRLLLDQRALGRCVEARPPAVGVELGLRLEQPGPAAGAQVGAANVGVPVRARERPLSAFLAQHVVLSRGQVSSPLRFALLNWCFLHLAPNLPVFAPRQTNEWWTGTPSRASRRR